jgi:polar amino acid transport system substrate-binding protein
MRRSLVLPAALTAAALILAGCSSAAKTASSPTPSARASCDPASLPTLTANTLTVGTDDPAYPPYFVDNKPANGKGFESAVAFAVAKQLGYPASSVKWTVKHFDSVVAGNVSGADFVINQISITPERAKVVDFSDGYYDVNQAVVAVKGGSGANATSFSALKQLKLGAQSATTSLTWINTAVQPTQTPQIYNSTNDAIKALENKQIDALVVDLPTAFYVTAAQMSDGVIVGQAKTGGNTGDKFGMVLEKGSKLTSCVDKAVAALKASGELQAIQDKWLSSVSGAPYLTP